MSLSWRVQAGYGAAELGINGVELLVRVSLLIFYTDVVGLAPALAGYAVALGVLWDALTDPLMGRISDTARFRRGRRRPFIALGALLLAGAVVVLFSPPATRNARRRTGSEPSRHRARGGTSDTRAPACPW